MGYTLKTKCSYCGHYGKHEVVHTDLGPYKWDDETDAIFKARLGKGLSYRRRTRLCQNPECRKKFGTVEMSWDYLKVMVEALVELEEFKEKEKIVQKKVNFLEDKINLLRKQKTDLEEKLRLKEKKYTGLVDYLKAAPIEHDFSCQEDETSVENEEKDGDHLSE